MNKLRGFTIIELMVTLVILGGGVGALTYLNSRLGDTTAFSAAQQDAVASANNKIDAWRAVLYDSISTVSDGTDSTTIGNTSFTRTWNIAEFTSPSYKVIDVTVSWTDSSGNSHSVKLATAVAKTSLANAST